MPDRLKQTVLVVDDDDEIRYSMRNLLTVEGYDVLLAADGLEALKLLETRRVEALILDLMMPRLDGVGVVRALLARPEHERPPVIIVISAYVELRRRVMGLRVNRIYNKPFDVVELVEDLNAALTALREQPQGISEQAS